MASSASFRLLQDIFTVVFVDGGVLLVDVFELFAAGGGELLTGAVTALAVTLNKNIMVNMMNIFKLLLIRCI